MSRTSFLYACFQCSSFILFCMRYPKVVPIYWFGICLFLFDFVFVFFMQIEIVYNYGREDNDWNLIFSCILTMNKGLQSNCSVLLDCGLNDLHLCDEHKLIQIEESIPAYDVEKFYHLRPRWYLDLNVFKILSLILVSACLKFYIKLVA